MLDNEYWQISRFIDGINLARPDYIYDSWRGIELAEFYKSFRENSKNIQTKPQLLKDFCTSFKSKLKNNDRHIFRKTEAIFHHLEQDFFDLESKLKQVFCHGDLHPLNIIWGEEKINSVIDWEFCGTKIETYDLANLIGCLGFELPVGLNSNFALEFLNNTRNCFQTESLQYLFETVLAIRLAWLSDWLLRKDKDMISLEISYLELLYKYRQELKDAWKI